MTGDTPTDSTVKVIVYEEWICAYRFDGRCGHNVAQIFPDGHYYGQPYEHLRELGSGTHVLLLDRSLSRCKGTIAQWDEERQAFELFRYAMAGYQCGMLTGSELLKFTLLAYTEKHAALIRSEVTPSLREDMSDYAKRIPASLHDRQPNQFIWWSSAGTTTYIPDANLLQLRHDFIVTGQSEC